MIAAGKNIPLRLAGGIPFSRYLPPAQVGARQNDIRITNNAVTETKKTIIYSKASPLYHFALVPNINTVP